MPNAFTTQVSLYHRQLINTPGSILPVKFIVENIAHITSLPSNSSVAAFGEQADCANGQ